MTPKYKNYDPEARYRPFCVNPCEGNYYVVDTLQEPWEDVIDQAMSRRRAVEEADALNKNRPNPTRLHTRKARST